MRIVLPYLPPKELSPNARLHWSKKQQAKHKMQDDVLALVKEQGWSGPALERAVVKFSWGMPDKRRRDLDNCLSSCKAALDAIVAAGVIVDDSWQNIKIEIEGFESPKKPMTIIEVREE